LGHKVHPLGFRLGIIRDWQSKWYSEAHYAEFVQEDNRLRERIKSRYPEAAISLIEIDRQAKDVTITLYTARPGIVIGRGGQRVDEMRQYLEQLIGKKIRLNIQEVRQPELDAYLVARSVAEQIERRVAYRRAMKQSIFRTIQAGAKGIKVSCAGRLGNAEIARRQTSHQGQVPLHTLRADIDYGFTEAHTTLGRIGVKVWIYKGQIMPEIKVEEPEEKPAAAAEAAPAPAPEEKPAAAEEKPAKAAAPEAKPEEKPARPMAKKVTKAAEAKAPEAETAVPEAKVKETGVEIKETKAKPKETKAAVKETKAEVKETKAEVKKPKAKVKETKAKAKEAKAAVKETKAEVKELKAEVKEPKAEVKETKTKVKEAKSAVKETKAEEKETKAPKKGRKTTATKTVAKAEEPAPEVKKTSRTKDKKK
jgi:small subunit ribosomal protein S3